MTEHDHDCFLFELKFTFDDRVISPWREKYIVTRETFERIRNSWGPSAYLVFDVVCKNGEYKKTVFINSTDVVLFEGTHIQSESHGHGDH